MRSVCEMFEIRDAVVGTTSTRLYHLTLTFVCYSLISPLSKHGHVFPSLLTLLQMLSFSLLLVFFFFFPVIKTLFLKCIKL